MVRVGAYRRTSLVDWPGKIVSTIFLMGCNFKCPWCHNREIAESMCPEIPEDVILEDVQRNKWIDGVCITGGEPTTNEKLIPFMSRFKEMGLLVKLDTNGSNPEILEKIRDMQLADYIAIDIKAPPHKYPILTGVSTALGRKVFQSAKLLLNSEIDYEFRTTFVPGLLTPQDVEKIANIIRGAKKYVIQHFLSTPHFSPTIDPSTIRELIHEAAQRARKYIKNVALNNLPQQSPLETPDIL